MGSVILNLSPTSDILTNDLGFIVIILLFEPQSVIKVLLLAFHQRLYFTLLLYQ